MLFLIMNKKAETFNITKSCWIFIPLPIFGVEDLGRISEVESFAAMLKKNCKNHIFDFGCRTQNLLKYIRILL